MLKLKMGANSKVLKLASVTQLSAWRYYDTFQNKHFTIASK